MLAVAQMKEVFVLGIVCFAVGLLVGGPFSTAPQLKQGHATVVDPRFRRPYEAKRPNDVSSHGREGAPDTDRLVCPFPHNLNRHAYLPATCSPAPYFVVHRFDMPLLFDTPTNCNGTGRLVTSPRCATVNSMNSPFLSTGTMGLSCIHRPWTSIPDPYRLSSTR